MRLIAPGYGWGWPDGPMGFEKGRVRGKDVDVIRDKNMSTTAVRQFKFWLKIYIYSFHTFIGVLDYYKLIASWVLPCH